MITKLDIMDRSRQWQLRPDVVEKDYVLGWLLAAIAQHEETSTNWVLKGGTCIKKCFVETYRFSEDLDFSLLEDAEYSEGDLVEVLKDVAALAEEMSGVQFDAGQISVHPKVDKLQRATFEGRIGYRGPMGQPNWPRVRFDITRHEPVIDDPVRRSILHGYPDPLPPEALVQTYSIEELLAEKARALVERARPRDLYDVVFLVDNVGRDIQLDHAREVFAEKCAAKQLQLLTAAAVVDRTIADGELAADWEGMLSYQLPQLPPISTVLTRLAAAISWLDAAAPLMVSSVAVQPGPALGRDEEIISSLGVTYWRESDVLEQIRYAGANRLLVEFLYAGKARLVEPYSLRRARSTGNILLHAHDVRKDAHRTYKVQDIRDVRVTRDSFVPRHPIEFLSSGNITIRESAERATYSFRRATSRSRARSYVRSGPTYVFQCNHCQKEFRHRRNDGTLRRHRLPGGYGYCGGRRGFLKRVDP